MRSRAPLALAVTVALGPLWTAAAEPAWAPADPGHRWSFPRDHFAQPGYRNEWWYFTGHLESVDRPGRRFGYQLTFFRIGLLPRRPDLDSAWATANLVMAHAAIGDLSAGAHHFTEVLYREMPLLGGFGSVPGPLVAWSRAPAGTDGRWDVRWNGTGFELEMADRARGMALSLVTRPAKPLVLEGPNGYSKKSERPGHASQYYSLTRLDTAGTLTLGGEKWNVRGSSWMDREVGSSALAPEQVGWDWFSLQLADGRDVMLYVLRRADGSADFRSATLVEGDGKARYLAPGEWSVRAERTWRSAATGATYPAGWRIDLPGAGLHLRIEPALADQENRSASGIFYWEGAVRIADAEGHPAGEGYVELTGYGKDSRPPL